MGEEGKVQQDNQSPKRGWRSRKLSKLEGGVGGSRNFPTWKGRFEVQEESCREKERKANKCERKREQ